MDNSDNKNQQRYIFSILSKLKASGGDGTTPDFSQARIEFVESLPTASANTLGVIYVIPNQDGESGSIHFTKYDGQSYSWVAAGEKGEAGETPNISIGTVTSGEQASATIGGTPANPVLNLVLPQGPQGPQGNTGSSVDYPYELVNNLTTNDATKGLSAAQGKVLKDEISQLEAEVTALSIPRAVKNALYTILQNVAFINDDGYATELAQIRAWVENRILMSISATFTQGTAKIYPTDSLDKLKQYLVVTATYDDSSTVVLNDSDYTLSGTLAIGTSTIVASYQGKTDTFTVEVSASPYLYVLPSAFSSDGNNYIDTLIKPEKGKTYTILVEFTQTNDSGARFIWGNRVSSSDNNYVGLTTQSGKMWGMGITYGGKVTIDTKVVRSSVVATINESGSFSNITHQYKVGSGAIQSVTISSSGGDSTVASDPNLTIGATYANSGIIGTINSFVIYDGEMLASEITDFLNNGM